MKTITSIKNNITILFVILMFSACTTDDSDDVTKSINTASFDAITVYHGIKVHITQSATQRIEAFANQEKLDNLRCFVDNGCLILEVKNTSFFDLDYKPVRVDIYTPKLTSIRNTGDHCIYSDGVLTFPSLTLLSENHQSNFSNIGNFDLNINNNSLNVVSNGLANIYVKGQTQSLTLGYYSGNGKFEGELLTANNVEVFHRGGNALKISPVQSLRGHLYSTGNLEVYQYPETVDIKAHYTGKLIYKN